MAWHRVSANCTYIHCTPTQSASHDPHKPRDVAVLPSAHLHCDGDTAHDQVAALGTPATHQTSTYGHTATAIYGKGEGVEIGSGGF